MPIQVDPPKPNAGKLAAAGILTALLLIALSMPRFFRALFVTAVVLAGRSAAWLFIG